MEKKIDNYDGKRKEEKLLIRYGKDTFISECASYAKFVAKKKESLYETLRKSAESVKKCLILALSEKNFTARKIRECGNHLEAQKEKMKLRFSLTEAYLFSKDVFPDVAVVLQLVLIYPASGAIVE